MATSQEAIGIIQQMINQSEDEGRQDAAGGKETVAENQYGERRVRQSSEKSVSQTSLRSAQSLPPVAASQTSSSSSSQCVERIQQATAAQRKRSRTGEHNTEDQSNKRVDGLLQQIQSLIDQVVKKSEKSKSIMEKINLGELMRELSMKYVNVLAYANELAIRVLNANDEKAKLMNRLQNSLDENNALQQQVITLQQQALKQGAMEQQQPAVSYLQMATKNIMTGRQLPIPQIAEAAKMSPSERILIFRAKVKGELPSKQEQEEFKNDIRMALGEVLIKHIVVIRPTRHGGYTIIFQSEESRDAALSILRENESQSGIEIKASCITAPKKKLAKAVCRQPPNNYPIQSFLQDFYGTNNMHLHQIPIRNREARIIETTNLGWVFELSSEEAAACYAQNGRIRYGYAEELKVEEFIPLQQCYRCCMFGHNASECISDVEYCRLCGMIGHSGKDCNKKEDKSSWSCINCKITNEAKGFKLPIDHAAAQLHKCPCAQNQKLVKKEQLAAAGIFTTPFPGESVYRKQEKINSNREMGTSGAHAPNVESKKGQRQKSRSKSQRRQQPQKKDRITAAPPTITMSAINTRDINTSASASSSSTSINMRDINMSSVISTNGMSTSSQYGTLQRTHRIQRPSSTEGWKYVGKPKEKGGEELRGRGSEGRTGGTNSTSSLTKVGQNTDTQMS